MLAVAASDSSDARWEKSNYGRCVSIYAPAVDLTSATYTDNMAVGTVSSTNTAAAHVSRVAALYLQSNVTAEPLVFVCICSAGFFLLHVNAAIV